MPLAKHPYFSRPCFVAQILLRWRKRQRCMSHCRRWNSQTSARAARREAEQLLSATSWDLPLKDGVEAIVLSCKATVEDLPGDHGILQIDFRKAFNSISRQQIIKEVRKRLPGLSAFAEFFHSHHSHLFYDDHLVSSECGVQQGEPLGPDFSPLLSIRSLNSWMRIFSPCLRTVGISMMAVLLGANYLSYRNCRLSPTKPRKWV